MSLKDPYSNKIMSLDYLRKKLSLIEGVFETGRWWFLVVAIAHVYHKVCDANENQTHDLITIFPWSDGGNLHGLLGVSSDATVRPFVIEISSGRWLYGVEHRVSKGHRQSWDTGDTSSMLIRYNASCPSCPYTSYQLILTPLTCAFVIH